MSNHGFVVTTMQQQTSFFIRNDTYVKLLYLKSKNEIGIYIRCNYQTTTDFFRHNSFLLVIVLSFTTIDEDSDYYNKKNGYIHG